MEALTVLLFPVLLLVIFDVLAMRYGVDSREAIGDDHVR